MGVRGGRGGDGGQTVGKGKGGLGRWCWHLDAAHLSRVMLMQCNRLIAPVLACGVLAARCPGPGANAPMPAAKQ
jgi:hypothetical protein